MSTAVSLYEWCHMSSCYRELHVRCRQQREQVSALTIYKFAVGWLCNWHSWMSFVFNNDKFHQILPLTHICVVNDDLKNWTFKFQPFIGWEKRILVKHGILLVWKGIGLIRVQYSPKSLPAPPTYADFEPFHERKTVKFKVPILFIMPYTLHTVHYTLFSRSELEIFRQQSILPCFPYRLQL